MARAAETDGTSDRHSGRIRVISIDCTLARLAPARATRSGHSDHAPRNATAPASINPQEIFAIRV